MLAAAPAAPRAALREPWRSEGQPGASWHGDTSGHQLILLLIRPLEPRDSLSIVRPRGQHGVARPCELLFLSRCVEDDDRSAVFSVALRVREAVERRRRPPQREPRHPP